jgi:hypothetical protein
VFVALALPHVHYGIGAGVPEAIDEGRVTSEMVIQHFPLSSQRRSHDEETLPVVFVCVRRETERTD